MKTTSKGRLQTIKSSFTGVLIPFQSVLLLKVTPDAKNRIARTVLQNPSTQMDKAAKS